MTELAKFPHKFTVTVRFNEVDMLSVCNNAVYLNFFEDGRLLFLKAAGIIPPGGVFSDGELYYMVRNEVDYRSHAYYDEELNIYTRISYIKNSSYGFEHIITSAKDGRVVVEGKGVVVHVSSETKKSAPLPVSFTEKVKAFQGEVALTGSTQ